jgi:hypothetical protein
MRRTFRSAAFSIIAGFAALTLPVGGNAAGFAPAASDGHRTHMSLDARYSPGPDASFMDWCRQPFPGGAGSHPRAGHSASQIMSSDGLQRQGIRRIDLTRASTLDQGIGRSFGTGSFYSSTMLSAGRERMIETSFRAQSAGPSIAVEPRALRATGQRESAHRSGDARRPDSSTALMLVLGVGLMVLVVRRRI